ncbi:hypothetical protein RUM43_000585 [Polyplax serrata]|uniref:Trehalase n=1 Tax=Polyplax serrata TaxID=468196 RepID=A0AAN8XNB5_POLSC
MNLVLLNKADEREKTEWNLPKLTWTMHQKCLPLCFLLSLLCILVTPTLGSEEEQPPPCDNDIYCYGELLHTIQMEHIYPDSKTFVDMKLKFPANVTLENFRTLLNKTNDKPTTDDLADFLKDYFEPVGKEFEEWTPQDWIEDPKFLSNINDPNYKSWAKQLNCLWKFLGKRLIEDVRKNPEFYSIIYVPNPVIVPGGRFREFYYWDSYWIIKGLLLSEMYVTVKGMLENFLSIVERYGHIPNGGRVYYLMRSHPPLLIPMVNSYLEVKNDVEFLKKNLPIMEMEFSYWMTNHSVTVTKSKTNYTLYRYIDRSRGPRPESYREDFLSASSFKTQREKNEYYSELKAAAEAGWDFSSRWFIKNGTNKGNLTDTKTKYIVPVELNSILYWNAQLLSGFWEKLGNDSKASYYANKANEILEAVTKVLWVEEVGVWLDYDILNEKERDYFYPTNFAPLWTGCYNRSNSNYIVKKVLKYIQDKKIMVTFLGGVPATLEHTNEQWDYPNAWPPLQHIMIIGLMNTGDESAKELAYELASRWVVSNYVAFNETGHMYEKYDATVVGGHGTGGEYDVQLGFGWSNGVIIDLLHLFGRRLSSDENNLDTVEDNSLPPEAAAASVASSAELLLPVLLTALVFTGIMRPRLSNDLPLRADDFFNRR